MTLTRPMLGEIRRIDHQLSLLRGLEALPGWTEKVDTLLDERRELMAVRDRGFRVSDRRRVFR